MIYKSILKCTAKNVCVYRYKDIFQIYPNNDMNTGFVDYYTNIEYDSDYTRKNLTELKETHTFPISEETLEKRKHLNFLKEIISILSIVTDETYEIYCENKEILYLLPEQEVIGNFTDQASVPLMTKKDSRITRTMKFNDDRVEIHSDADVFFCKYFSLSDEDREKYNASIFLYNMAHNCIGKNYSMAILLYVSAIENLVDFDSKVRNLKFKPCKECDQQIRKISSRFKEFMEKYSIPEGVDVFNKFYDLRSKIAHAGQLLTMDTTLTFFNREEYDQVLAMQMYARVAIFRYLLALEK